MAISDILNQLQNISVLSTLQDIQAVIGYMQKVRALGVTPGKVAERGLDFAEDLVFNRHADKTKAVRMELAVYIAVEAAKEVGVHAETRRRDKIEEKIKAE